MSKAFTEPERSMEGEREKGRNDNPVLNADKAQDVDLLDLLIVVAKHKSMILRATLGMALLGGLISMVWPVSYVAETRVLPPQQSQSMASSLMSQLGPLAGLAGLGGKDLGLKNSSDLYVAMLQSRTVADALISRFQLMKNYSEKRLVDARKDLEDNSKILAGKDNVISISVEDRNPKLAAELANAYVDELYKLNQQLAISEASQRRLFFEAEMRTAKERLADAEVNLKKTQEKTGLLALDSQAKVILEAVAALQAQIAAKQVQVTSMHAFATEQNPEYLRRKSELAALQAQLTKLQKGQHSGDGDIQVSTGNVPSAGLEYVRSLREVKYQEAIFEVLAKQYEAAAIDEAKNASIIQVLDKAVEPEKRAKPKRILVIGVVTALGCLLSIFAAFIFEGFARLKSQEKQARKLRHLLMFLSGSA